MSAHIRDLLDNYHKIEVVEKIDLDDAIKLLVCKGCLSDKEVLLLSLFVNQYEIDEISTIFNTTTRNIYYRINNIVEKFDDIMGYEYSDDRIFESVSAKLCRKLTKKEKDFCLRVIKNGKLIKGKSIFNCEK